MGTSEAVITLYDAPMWRAMEAGRLKLQCCAGCGTFRYPPGPSCPECLSLECAWQEVSGKGEVLSWVVFRKQYFEDFPAPYNAVAVKLEEGPILVSNLEGPEPPGSWIGEKVALTYRRHGERVQHAVRWIAAGTGRNGDRI